MVKRTLILSLLSIIATCSFAQKDSLQHRMGKGRVWVSGAANAVFWSGSYVALNKAWYADYPRSKFHLFNDNAEWNQMDKAGHIWTSYSISRASAELWKWAGLNANSSAVLGAAGGLVYQGIIELQDAYSSQWGFSWGDVGANAFGAGLFAAEQLAWQQQRIQVKFSYTPYDYPSDLSGRRDHLFGRSLAERMLKDYNSQTYWASANLSSFFPESRIPEWLNLSVGYGSDGLLGARSNTWTDAEGKTHDYSTTLRTRRFYLSPDIDLTQIRTRSRLLRSAFFVLNSIKIPAPALELNSRGKFTGHLIRF